MMQTRNAISAMLTNPHRMGYARRPDFDGFTPRTPAPHSLMAAFFVRLTQLGSAYWTQPPSLLGWEDHRASR